MNACQTYDRLGLGEYELVKKKQIVCYAKSEKVDLRAEWVPLYSHNNDWMIRKYSGSERLIDLLASRGLCMLYDRRRCCCYFAPFTSIVASYR